MNKPELISFSDFLMIAPFYDQRQFFAPEIEHMKGGVEGLLAAGLFKEDGSDLIEIDGSVAILTIEGPLRPGRDWYFSTGYGDIQDAIVELIDDTRVRTVIQKIDSPGGTVKQAFETEEMFQELAKEKRLISLVTGSATSAAALMTFPAEQRYLASKTAQTGSIGVVAEHVNNIAWYREMWGEIRTSVAKGELKDAGTDTRPYDEKAQKVFEESVSKLYDIFANEAVKGLGLSREQVDAQQSQVFIGADGIKEGFADGFTTLSDLIAQLKTQTIFSTPGRPAFQTHTKETSMDINQLKAEYPDVYQAVLSEGKKMGLEASKEEHVGEGKALGILAERKRMNDIDALSLPSEFAQKAKESDWTAEHTAAEYLRAEAKKRQEIASNMESDLNDGLESDAPAPPEKPEGEQASDPVVEYEAAVVKAMDGGKVSRGQAMKIVKNVQPELHQKFIEKSNERGS